MIDLTQYFRDRGLDVYFATLSNDELSVAFLDGNLKRPPTSTEQSQINQIYEQWQLEAIDRTKVQLLELLENKTEIVRSKVITTKPGKIGEYVQKQNEYQRWVSANRLDPIPLDYIIVHSEAVAYGVTALDLMLVWEQKIQETYQSTSDIVGIYRNYVEHIKNSNDEGEVYNLYDLAVEELENL